MIEIRGLRKEYGRFAAVEGLDLTIQDGQFVVLLGPSGSGKTTVLRMLNRMVTPTAGTVLIDGVDTATQQPEELRRHIGYVIQNTGLFPNMTVARNVSAVPRLLGWDRRRIEQRVAEMLQLAGLDPTVYGRKLPAQLSGGEAQRVGVARALAADPPLLLMDEPFSAVDPITRERLQLELKRLHRQVRKTIVFVTHDINEAVLLADRIVLLQGGVLQQYATPEELWREPANDFVRSFFGVDLGLRLLNRRRLAEIALQPLDGPASGLPTVTTEATLRDALAQLVNERADRLLVTGPAGPVGTVSFGTLLAALGRETE